MQSQDIKNIVNNMPGLPSMPSVISEALNIIENPKSNINQLSEIISKDIALTTQILKLVNSAYYGFPSQITTINKAMALLGFNKVKSLILSVAVKPMMMSNCGKAVWEHSIRCAVGCKIIGAGLGYEDADEAFIIGLLHDIGKTAMEIINKEAAKEILRLTNLGADILQAEKMFYGFTHTEMGKELVQKWKLPVIIASTIEHHHSPQKSEDKLRAGIVYIANKITHEQLKYPIFDTDITDTFDFEIPDPNALREEIFEQSQHILQALSK